MRHMKIALVMLAAGPVSAQEVGFTVSGNVIIDNLTDLEWMMGPDRDMTWDEARDWVTSLGDDWRMPSRGELARLMNYGVNSDAWGSLASGDVKVWTGVVRDDGACWPVDLDSGTGDWYSPSSSLNIRAIAVRP